jgi:hypothetical protein
MFLFVMLYFCRLMERNLLQLNKLKEWKLLVDRFDQPNDRMDFQTANRANGGTRNGLGWPLLHQGAGDGSAFEGRADEP